MKRKVLLLKVTCRRCGKSIYTASRSFYGNDAEKSKYDRICGNCIMPEEKRFLETLRPKIGGLK